MYKFKINRLKSYFFVHIKEQFRLFSFFRNQINQTLYSIKYTPKQNNINVAVPIFHWGGTNVSWLQLCFALLFIEKKAKLFFIIDENFFSEIRISLNAFLVKLIVKKLCSQNYAEILDIRKFGKKYYKNSYYELCKYQQYFNLQWRKKKSINIDEFKINNLFLQKSIIIAEKIDDILKTKKIDLCFCPGGIYGNSFLWRKLCDQNDIRFPSFDGDETKLLITPSGVACHRSDVIIHINDSRKVKQNEKKNEQNVYSKLVKADIYKRSTLLLNDKSELHTRTTYKQVNKNLVNQFFKKYNQTQISQKNYLNHVVIFLNTSWDSAALDLEPCLTSQTEWLDMLIDDIHKSCCENKITIRQHPNEKFYPSNDNYLDIVKKYKLLYPDLEIELINEGSNINSYDLILSSTSVFTFSSTIGLESCVLGRPTFVFKKNYQVETGALPQYKPNSLDQCAKKYFSQAKSYWQISIQTYYFGQMLGWEEISIPNLSEDIKKPMFLVKISKLANVIIDNKYCSNNA